MAPPDRGDGPPPGREHRIDLATYYAEGEPRHVARIRRRDRRRLRSLARRADRLTLRHHLVFLRARLRPY